MTITETIQKAIEGGWKEKYFKENKEFSILPGENVIFYMFTSSLYEMCLDPEWWQALGKSLGWEKDERGIMDDELGIIPVVGEWKSKWMNLIMHLLDGKSIESYFETL